MHDAPLAIAAVLGIIAGVVPVLIGSTLQHFKVSRSQEDSAQRSSPN